VIKSGFFRSILVLIVLISACAYPQHKSIKKLKAGIQEILKDSLFESTQLSLVVHNLSTKKDVFTLQPKLLLVPASNTKILTTSTALYFLGKDFTYKTIISTDGVLSGGLLKGNLFIKGGYDPELREKDLEFIVDTLYAMGIREITGNVYADISLSDTLTKGAGWTWDEDPSYYAPYITSFGIEKNSVAVTVQPNSVGESPSITYIPLKYKFEINNQAVTTDTGVTNIVITRDIKNNTNELSVQGVIRSDAPAVTDEINLVHPEHIALKVFTSFLELKGIQYKESGFAKTPITHTPLYVHSRPLLEVLTPLNKTSDNLSAENTLRILGSIKRDTLLTADLGKIFVDSLISLSGWSPNNYRMLDGSGLSRYNLFSTGMLSNLLTFFYEKHPEIYTSLRSTFPIAGVDGTLKRRMIKTEAQGRVFAKTGTLSGVNALSGYIDTKSGDVFVFSMLLQNHINQNKRALELMNKICEVIVAY